MAITAHAGPVVSFGQGQFPDYNPQMGSSLFWAGIGVLDPRPQFTYLPGNDVNEGVYAWSGDQDSIVTSFVVPQTKSNTIIAAAAHTVGGTAMTLASANATGLAVGVSLPRQDTGVTVTGLLELDPLVASVTANTVINSNILTVTAVGSGTAVHPFGLCPGMVLTDSTHAAAFPTGTTITGYISGSGGAGQYTTSANATATYTGDTITGLYTAFPHAIPFGQVGTVRMWNANAMCARAVSITSTTSQVVQTFTVNGLDVYGFPMTEVITLSGTTATTTNGVKAFKYIKTVTPSVTDATGSYSVGTQDVIGFAMRSDNYQPGAGLDVQMTFNNALITSATGYTAAVKTTPATATTGDVRGTYALQTASNGTLAFVVSSSPLIPNVNSAIGLYGVPQYTAW